MRGRFRRSTQLEKDFAATSQGDGYILTSTARDTLRRIVDSLSSGSTSRAWTLTGPYGVGKSAFAVFLTQLFCGSGEQRRNALKQVEEVDKALAGRLRELNLFENSGTAFLPVLATARRAPASKSVAESLVASAGLTRNAKIAGSVRTLSELLKANSNGQIWDTRQVVTALQSLSQAAGLSGYRGVLIIIDELGKLFEYAARYPQKSDVFLLQEVAEQAARNGVPLVFVGLLHQSFEAYGLHLDLATRREWAKIQGRFEDIAFLEPPEQLIRIIARAIEWTTPAANRFPTKYTSLLANDASVVGVPPPGMQGADFIAAAMAAYPLHPVTLVAVPYVFRRFAQNERSLFSYLSSLEPYGFQEFLKTHEQNCEKPPVIRLADLFDYFTRSFGGGLYRHPHALRWLEAADVLERTDDLSNLQREIVKTVGVLNALGEFSHLQATEDMISFAVADSVVLTNEVREAIALLKDASILTYRKFNRSYRIWEGSDVDIEERIAEGERKVREDLDLAQSVRRYLPPKPLVARRHSYETGALRYFSVEYVDAPDRIAAHLQPAAGASGGVLVCLAESPAVAERFREIAVGIHHRLDLVFAIPQHIGELRAVVSELGALRWAWDNTPELRDDRVARREMALRISEADQLLQRSVAGLLDPRDEPIGSGCLWIHAGGVRDDVTSPVGVSQFLSRVCDELYHKTPKILNELIVRRSLSSAAAAARRNLMERMLNNAGDEALGISGFPPERSMYESVLRATGLHRQDRDGRWGFHDPGNRSSSKIAGPWGRLNDEIFKHQPEPVPVVQIYDILQSPPYGVLPGLHPVLICAFMLAHPSETTLYKEGTFLPEPQIADFEILTRRPELFAIAGSQIAGGRAIVVERLAKGLKAEPATVPVVRALYRMVKALPEYTWNTRKLPDKTLAFRDAFLKAKSPEQFLFVLLPEALGISPISDHRSGRESAEQFFIAMNESLQNLARATPDMLKRSRDVLLQACGLHSGEDSWSKLRTMAVAMEPALTEPHLLSFVRRVVQAGTGTAAVESVLAFVANRPPMNWNDTDDERFPDAAAALGGAFREAATSKRYLRSAEVELMALSSKERRQLQRLEDGIRGYISRNTKDVSARVINLAVTRLLGKVGQ